MKELLESGVLDANRRKVLIEDTRNFVLSQVTEFVEGSLRVKIDFLVFLLLLMIELMLCLVFLCF